MSTFEQPAIIEPTVEHLSPLPHMPGSRQSLDNIELTIDNNINVEHTLGNSDLFPIDSQCDILLSRGRRSERPACG